MLSKLTILAFRDENLTDPSGRFVLQVNPEKFSRTFENQYRPINAVAGSGTPQAFAGIGEPGLTLEFMIDATGVIPGVTSVPAKLKELRETIAEYVGSIHAPPYLRVVWGDLDFPCRMTQMTVDYTLFSTAGIPLRSKVRITFTHHEAPNLRVARARSSSPDLTHSRLVRAGDTLPLICQEVYREDRYYPVIARYNDLDTLVILPPGTTLSIPPLGDA